MIDLPDVEVFEILTACSKLVDGNFTTTREIVYHVGCTEEQAENMLKWFDKLREARCYEPKRSIRIQP